MSSAPGEIRAFDEKFRVTITHGFAFQDGHGGEIPARPRQGFPIEGDMPGGVLKKAGETNPPKGVQSTFRSRRRQGKRA